MLARCWPATPDEGMVAAPGGITQAAATRAGAATEKARLRIHPGYHAGGGSRRRKVSPCTTIENTTTT